MAGISSNEIFILQVKKTHAACVFLTVTCCIYCVLLSSKMSSSLFQFLELCQSPTGGFGGGPGQMSHLATTYAAMNAIAILGVSNFTRAYQVVNRKTMEKFLYSVRNNDGSFCMHVNGEKDTRALYCAASLGSNYCRITASRWTF